MTDAKHKLTKITDFRFYKEYIRKQLAGDFALDLSSHIEAIQAELDAAKAHIAALETAGRSVLMDVNSVDYWYALDTVLAKTPAQSLADVQASAIVDAIDETGGEKYQINAMIAYANQLKNNATPK